MILGTNPDGGYSVQQTTDGGYILAGSKWGIRREAWLIKVGGEQAETTKTSTVSPTENATVIPTEKAETVKSPTAAPTEKVAGFELVLTITTLSAVYLFIKKRI